MSSTYWDENIPSGTSSIRLGDDDIRSFKTNLRGGLAEEHVWPTGPSTADRGLHTPNASRVSYGAKSSMPATVSDKTGLVFQQTSAPFLALSYTNVGGSELSMPLGGRRSLFADGNPDTDSYWVVSAATGDSGGSISYGVTFGGLPFVTATVENASDDLFATIKNIGTTDVDIDATDDGGVKSVGEIVHVWSYGTVSI